MVTIVKLSEIAGNKPCNLPNKKIVKDAQKNFCLSPSFWIKIKEGKIPYVKKNNAFVEATYNQTIASLNNKPTVKIYWK